MAREHLLVVGWDEIEKSSGTSQFVFEQNTLLENNDLKKNVVSVVKQERVR